MEKAGKGPMPPRLFVGTPPWRGWTVPPAPVHGLLSDPGTELRWETRKDTQQTPPWPGPVGGSRSPI